MAAKLGSVCPCLDSLLGADSGPLFASAAIDAANRRPSVRGAAHRSCCARARRSQPLSPTVRMLQPSRLPDARQRAPTYPHAAAVYEQLCNHVAADLVEDGKRQKRTSSKPRSCTDLGHCVTASQTVRKLALCCSPSSPRVARSADPAAFSSVRFTTKDSPLQ